MVGSKWRSVWHAGPCLNLDTAQEPSSHRTDTYKIMSSSSLLATSTNPPDPADFTTTIISTLSPVSTQTATVYDRDPYLDYQPAFSYSLPMQFLLTGVILALSTILLIHLVFTAPYHWPLAKLNYGLQLSGVISLLLSLGITLSVIMGDVLETSREWPYMLNYVAVDVPLQNWTQVDSGWWYTLDAVTSGLAHVGSYGHPGSLQ
jgi:hypothetical protein